MTSTHTAKKDQGIGLGLRVPPQKRRDKLCGLLYNRGHESKNQYQREAIGP